MEQKRYCNIDFLRFFFVILIVYFHFIRLPFIKILHIPFLENLTKNAAWIGEIGNAILFIISGFFLYATFIKYQEPFIKFAIRKLVRFLPVLCFAIILMGILDLCGLCKVDVGQNILNMFLITKGAGGLTSRYSSFPTSWFVCALFWCSLFYYALYIIIKDKFKFNFIISIITYYNLVIYLNSVGIRHQEVIHGIFSKSGTSAMGMIGLGILLYQLYNQINWNKIKVNPILLTFLEGALATYLIRGCIFKEFKETYLVMVLASIALFILFLINKGFVSRFFNMQIFSKVGRYSFAIYIMQEVSFVFYKHYFWINSAFIETYALFLIYASLCFSVSLGVLTYYLVENPCAKYLKKNLLDKYDDYFTPKESNCSANL